MSLCVGIIGLPNFGKSTIFNALTNANVALENYAFCTTDLNQGSFRFQILVLILSVHIFK